MALKPFGSKFIPPILALVFISLTLVILLNKKSEPKPNSQYEVRRIQNESSTNENTRWYDVLRKEIQGKTIKIGLVNMDEGVGENDQIHGLGKAVTVRFDRVDKDLQWSDFFPSRIDEDEKEGQPSCPKIPMPKFEDYQGLHAVVARVPCERGAGRQGVRDVFRLQLNLVVANLLVRNGWSHHNNQLERGVYAVFIGSCGPMRELFRCEDLLLQEDDIFVYKPHLRKLNQKVLMPVGTCQLARPFQEPGEEMRRRSGLSKPDDTLFKPREAYVTHLHSSDTFVCGAITLAQSLIQTNTSKDLVLLADNFITRTSLHGLREAGWKIKYAKRIRNPTLERITNYNEWFYSKLEVWKLTEYDKVFYIDSDLLVLQNMDKFFVYPQLSAVGEEGFYYFNAGVMLIEPSKCTYETLIKKMFEVESYDAGDQGFLNAMFTWWHRWPSRVNHLKVFRGLEKKNRDILGNPYAVHYISLVKPWMCEENYDCMWDVPTLEKFASDSAQRMWLQFYETLPKRLQWYCDRTLKEDPTFAKIRRWRLGHKYGNFLHGYWKICFLIALFPLLLFLCVFWREKLKAAFALISFLAWRFSGKLKKSGKKK